MKNSIFLLLIITSFISCKKETTLTNNDYFTFGTFCEIFMGNDCVKLYVIEDDKLSIDPNGFNGTKIGYITLNDEKYKLVKDLVNYIPNELFQKESETFGCPGCLGQVGLYVRYYIKGVNGEFRIDKDKSKIPNYLHEFVDKINEKMEVL